MARLRAPVSGGEPSAVAAELDADLQKNTRTFATRIPNWRVFALETKLDPRYARAQRRYVGASGSVVHNDPEALPAKAHTLSIMEMPEGHHQPFHDHDEDEIFFVLEGACTVMWKSGDTIVERRLGKWDMANNPAGRIHAIRNDGPGPVFFQVMLASPQPKRPRYEDEALLKLQAEDDPDRG
jgi:mannose-6-phosphate isomerase-like protein (cupin superfamily)